MGDRHSKRRSGHPKRPASRAVQRPGRLDRTGGDQSASRFLPRLDAAQQEVNQDRACCSSPAVRGTLLAAAQAQVVPAQLAQAQEVVPQRKSKPNILVIFGDDVGVTNISAYSDGLMGYETPNIDRIAKEGLRFLHYYGEQSCTAGRAAFLTGQHGIRTGLTKVGFPGAPMGMSQHRGRYKHGDSEYIDG